MIAKYDRISAVNYAKLWHNLRNPKYYNFNLIGGDCTNFASQCLYAGAKTMNYTKDLGWYYNSAKDRSASWAGVEFFYNFITNNNITPIGSGAGPFGIESNLNNINIGDFIQLYNGSNFYHTLIITGFDSNIPLLTAHTNDVLNKPLIEYNFYSYRCIKILGIRK